MSKLSSKHQVTIPVRVLREAGLTAGDEIVIRASAPGRIELERADDLADRYAGCLLLGALNGEIIKRTFERAVAEHACISVHYGYFPSFPLVRIDKGVGCIGR